MDIERNILCSQNTTCLQFKTFENKIPTVITFVFYPIAEEATKTSLRFELSSLMKLNQDKTSTTKNLKGTIVKRDTIQSFIWLLVVKDMRKDSINSVKSNKGNFNPKTLRMYK